MAKKPLSNPQKLFDALLSEAGYTGISDLLDEMGKKKQKGQISKPTLHKIRNGDRNTRQSKILSLSIVLSLRGKTITSDDVKKKLRYIETDSQLQNKGSIPESLLYSIDSNKQEESLLPYIKAEYKRAEIKLDGIHLIDRKLYDSSRTEEEIDKIESEYLQELFHYSETQQFLNSEIEPLQEEKVSWTICDDRLDLLQLG